MKFVDYLDSEKGYFVEEVERLEKSLSYTKHSKKREQLKKAIRNVQRLIR